MEVPAKRVRLSPRELKLLDLDEDALIIIIDELDHKSKLQMMATCKRFDELIRLTNFTKTSSFASPREKIKRIKLIIWKWSGENLELWKFRVDKESTITKVKSTNI
jgi:hypothetical protein